MPTDYATRQLARTIARTNTRAARETRAQARASQAAYRSVELSDGPVSYYDEDGVLRLSVGVQDDGTYGILEANSEPPPMPTAPDVVGVGNGLLIRWDGTFEETERPMNLKRVEIHVNVDPDFVADDTTQVSEFVSVAGGTYVFPCANSDGILYTALVAVNNGEVESERSESVAGQATLLVADTDDTAPAASPAALVTGGLRSLFVQWTPVANHDPVTYEVHVSTVTGFAPSPATLSLITVGSSANIRSMPNGDGMVPGTVYYVKIIAKDADGSAAAGVQGSATPIQISGPDVAAEYVYTNRLFANQIDTGELLADVTVTGKLKTAASGQRTEIDSFGWKQIGSDGISVNTEFPNDSTKMARINAIITAQGLTVLDALELRGVNNIFAMGSKTVLQTTTTGSGTAPGATVDYEVSAVNITEYLFDVAGLYLDSTLGDRHTAGRFFSVGQLRNNGFTYAFPFVVIGDGSNRSTHIPYCMTRIANATGSRSVTLGETFVAGQSGYAPIALRLYDDAPLLTAGAPILKGAEISLGTFNFFYNYQLGRCYSAIASSTLKNQVVMARVDVFNSVNNLLVRRYTAEDAGLAQVSTITVTAPWDTTSDEKITGISYGSSAKMLFHGADTTVYVVHTTVNNYVYNSTMTARLADLDFPAIPGMYRCVAVGDVSTNLFTKFACYQSGATPTLNLHTNMSWPATDSSIWWVGYTWYDSVGTTHETNLSVSTSVTMKKRARILVTVPDLPDPAAGHGTTRLADDVNSFRPYFGRGAVKPANSGFWKQTNNPADLALALAFDVLPLFTGTIVVDNPPTVTSFPVQASAVIQSTAIGTDGLPKFRLSGDGSSHFEALDISGVGAAALTGKAFEQLYYSIRAQSQLAGGGIKAVDATYNISWSARFLAMSLGRGTNLATGGFFQIDMPSNATVIGGFGGATAKTVTAGKIALANWDALWYELPYGSGTTSVNGNFRVTNFSSDYTVPNNWILLAFRNGDLASVEWATGDVVDPGFDSDSPVFKQVIASSTANATALAGNKSALRIGNIAASHLRLDGDSIIKMTNDNTQGSLILNPGKDVRLGTGGLISGIRWGTVSPNTDASSQIAFNHSLGTTPIAAFIQSRNSLQYQVFSVGASQITCTCRTAAGVLTGTGVATNIFWWCIY